MPAMGAAQCEYLIKKSPNESGQEYFPGRSWGKETTALRLLGLREIKSTKQIIDSRTVQRYIGVAGSHLRVREIVAATGSERLQLEVPLDEFDDRNVVRIRVANNASRAEWGNDQQRNAGAIAEEIERLDVA